VSHWGNRFLLDALLKEAEEKACCSFVAGKERENIIETKSAGFQIYYK
jgi:hypothetical protein